VKLSGANPTCADVAAASPQDPPRGRLRARAVPAAVSTSECIVPPNGGYRRLENQLYRVEIHDSATYVWSRDNGSVIARLEGITTSTANKTAVATVSHTGRDATVGFGPEQIVEITDEGRLLRSQPGVLAQIDSIEGRTLLLSHVDAVPLTMADFPVNPIVRRWDGTGTVETGKWVELEDGVFIEFAAGPDPATAFRTGDYWTIPARTLTGQVEWPRSGGVPRFEERQGPRRQTAPLAIASVDANGVWSGVRDCRKRFPPLTAIEATDVGYDDQRCTLSTDAQILAGALGHSIVDGPVDNVQEALDVLCTREATYQHAGYMAGDGQEGSPGRPLPVQPTVTVRNALGRPIPNVKVSFKAIKPDGQDGPSMQVNTDAAGEARITWTLDPAPGLNQLVAAIQPPQGGEQRVRFNARGSVPATGGGLCSITVGDGVRSHGQFTGPDELQAAVDAAIAAGGATICVLPGIYPLTKTIRVDQAKNLTIHGSRLETVVSSNSIMPFHFSGCTDVELSDLQVVGTEIEPQTDPDGLVSFHDCSGVTVQRCRVLGVNVRRPDQPDSACVLLDGCRDAVLVQECDLAMLATGSLGGITLRRTERAQLRRNTVRVLAIGGSFGVDLDNGSTGCLVVDNDIEALQPDETQNLEGAAGGVHVGSACHEAVVRDNRIDGGSGLGVALGSIGEDGGSLGGIHGLEIDGNTITRMAAGGVGLVSWRQSSEAPVTDRLTLRRNRIEACSYGPATVFGFTRPVGSVAGIRLAGAVVLWMGAGMRLFGNEVVDNGQLGTLKPPHPVPGIVVFVPGAGLSVAHNRCRNNLSGNPSAPPFPAVVGGIFFGSISTFDDGPVATVRANEVVAPVGRALLLVGNGSVGSIQVSDNHFSGEGRDPIVELSHDGGTVQFCDNYVVSQPTGADHAVEITARHVTFVANHCVCPSSFPRVDHVLVQVTGSVSATGNHVLESNRQPLPSLHLTNTSGTNNTLAAVNNLTTSGVLLDQPGIDVGNLAGILA
jgi:hypothetical protein